MYKRRKLSIPFGEPKSKGADTLPYELIHADALATVIPGTAAFIPAYIPATCGAAADELRQLHPQHPVELKIAEGLTVRGDRVLLSAVLQNLLGNAWKFTGKKQHPRVEVGRRLESGHEVFYVRDNGAGFDMAYAGKLFTVFQRLHVQTEFPGTGVGLATVQRIIARHGRRLWAEGAVGEGATFYFTLEAQAAGS